MEEVISMISVTLLIKVSDPDVKKDILSSNIWPVFLSYKKKQGIGNYGLQSKYMLFAMYFEVKLYFFKTIKHISLVKAKNHALYLKIVF